MITFQIFFFFFFRDNQGQESRELYDRKGHPSHQAEDEQRKYVERIEVIWKSILTKYKGFGASEYYFYVQDQVLSKDYLNVLPIVQIKEAGAVMYAISPKSKGWLKSKIT